MNIHYKTPVRYEYKDPISDAELLYREEQMKKIYQEERRRKYLQELQDLNNRRHTDNFTPTQKSPIPLNRYDDFGSDYRPKSPNFTRCVARALYNFQGASARYVIYLRIDEFAIFFLSLDSLSLYSFCGCFLFFLFVHFVHSELSFKKGDIIYIRREIDKNWYEGEHNAMVGLLPANYVEVS